MLVRSFLIVVVLMVAGCHTPPNLPPRVRFEEKADAK